MAAQAFMHPDKDKSPIDDRFKMALGPCVILKRSSSMDRYFMVSCARAVFRSISGNGHLHRLQFCFEPWEGLGAIMRMTRMRGRRRKGPNSSLGQQFHARRSPGFRSAQTT